MRGVSSILSLFRNGLNKFKYVRFYLSADDKRTLNSQFGVLTPNFCHIHTRRRFGSHYITYDVNPLWTHQGLHR